MSEDEFTKIVSYSGLDSKGQPMNVELTIVRGDGRRGLLRTMLFNRAREAEKAWMEGEVQDDVGMANFILHTSIWPACIASVEKQTGFAAWPLSYEDFAALPDAIINAWEGATFDLNPNWLPEEVEKKVNDTSSGQPSP